MRLKNCQSQDSHIMQTGLVFLPLDFSKCSYSGLHSKILFTGSKFISLDYLEGFYSQSQTNPKSTPCTPFVTLFLFPAETGPIDPVLVEKYNTPGFVGCLSRVQFNSIAPLKAAIHSRPAVSVSHQGKLVESNCGSSPLTVSPMSTNTDSWHLNAGTKTNKKTLAVIYRLKCVQANTS